MMWKETISHYLLLTFNKPVIIILLIIPCNFVTCLIFCLVEPFIYKFENASVSEGEAAYIHCFSRGDPPPEILLFKGIDMNAIRTEHNVNLLLFISLQHLILDI